MVLSFPVLFQRTYERVTLPPLFTLWETEYEVTSGVGQIK
jgi:hypothetical protein